jgi:ankyrin repeat protein
MLLDAGADLTAKNEAGQKPVDVAKLNGEKKMVEWLKEKRAAALA